MNPSEIAAPHPLLTEAGLNLVAIFDLSALPADITAGLVEAHTLKRFRQLILVGHAGPGLWRTLNASPFRQAADPIDRFTIDRVHHFFSAAAPGYRYEILYPGSGRPPLQRLGALAGWHHPSPFWLGINGVWGSWFSYRAAVVADSDFAPTLPLTGASPCEDCRSRPCLAACPANALVDGSLAACLDYRLAKASRCQLQCPARLACPVGSKERYSDAQIRYHYGQSLETLRAAREITD